MHSHPQAPQAPSAIAPHNATCYHHATCLDGSHLVSNKPKLEPKGKRENKNRPMAISSKKPVGRFREITKAPWKVVCNLSSKLKMFNRKLRR
ncbi:hypothetical protein QVD17_20485 [Tagetes erecta]|uniref:Uncharacterized protein n=1 Tax=Tagetes erecta TaxID=13708 RepID=A0AAD8KSX6_TARER|nr:hypothetical protein QVD17_20485 [Tagetes erecta]